MRSRTSSWTGSGGFRAAPPRRPPPLQSRAPGHPRQRQGRPQSSAAGQRFVLLCGQALAPCPLLLFRSYAPVVDVGQVTPCSRELASNRVQAALRRGFAGEDLLLRGAEGLLQAPDGTAGGLQAAERRDVVGLGFSGRRLGALVVRPADAVAVGGGHDRAYPPPQLLRALSQAVQGQADRVECRRVRRECVGARRRLRLPAGRDRSGPCPLRLARGRGRLPGEGLGDAVGLCGTGPRVRQPACRGRPAQGVGDLITMLGQHAQVTLALRRLTLDHDQSSVQFGQLPAPRLRPHLRSDVLGGPLGVTPARDAEPP